MNHLYLPRVFKIVFPCLAFALNILPSLHAKNDPITHTIDSQTVVTSPSDRKRRTLGIGEEVTLTFLGAGHKATWTLEGGGKIDGGTAPVPGKSSVTFTAPDVPTPTTTPIKITAKCDETDGGQTKIEFTIIAPKGVVMEKLAEVAKQKNPSLGVYMTTDVYITPHHVNFEKIKVKEDACGPVTAGYFTYQTDSHGATASWIGMSSHVEGKGTKLSLPDKVRGGTNGPTYTPGTFSWSIPWRYELNGDKGVFGDPVVHLKTLTISGSTATLTLTKAGAEISETNP